MLYLLIKWLILVWFIKLFRSIWNNRINMIIDGVQQTISLLVHTSKEFLVTALTNAPMNPSLTPCFFENVSCRDFIPVRTNIECRSAKNPFLFINYIIQLDLHSFNASVFYIRCLFKYSQAFKYLSLKLCQVHII